MPFGSSALTYMCLDKILRCSLRLEAIDERVIEWLLEAWSFIKRMSPCFYDYCYNVLIGTPDVALILQLCTQNPTLHLDCYFLKTRLFVNLSRRDLQLIESYKVIKLHIANGIKELRLITRKLTYLDLKEDAELTMVLIQEILVKCTSLNKVVFLRVKINDIDLHITKKYFNSLVLCPNIKSFEIYTDCWVETYCYYFLRCSTTRLVRPSNNVYFGDDSSTLDFWNSITSNFCRLVFLGDPYWPKVERIWIENFCYNPNLKYLSCIILKHLKVLGECLIEDYEALFGIDYQIFPIHDDLFIERYAYMLRKRFESVDIWTLGQYYRYGLLADKFTLNIDFTTTILFDKIYFLEDEINISIETLQQLFETSITEAKLTITTGIMESMIDIHEIRTQSMKLQMFIFLIENVSRVKFLIDETHSLGLEVMMELLAKRPIWPHLHLAIRHDNLEHFTLPMCQSVINNLTICFIYNSSSPFLKTVWLKTFPLVKCLTVQNYGINVFINAVDLCSLKNLKSLCIYPLSNYYASELFLILFHLAKAVPEGTRLVYGYGPTFFQPTSRSRSITRCLGWHSRAMIRLQGIDCFVETLLPR